MSILITEACCLVQAISDVSIHELFNKATQATFCKAYQFHAMQEYLNPDNLDKLLNSLSAEEIVCLTDRLRIRFIFGLVDEFPIAFGPFCSEVLTKSDLRLLLSDPDFIDFPVQDFLAWRSQFQVLEERQAIHYMQCLLFSLLGRDSTWSTKTIDFSENVISDENSGIVHKSYSEVIEERYRTEQSFMNNIKNGKTVAAIEQHRIMQRDVIYLKRLGNVLANERAGAAITQTTCRIAALQAGLPATLVDAISGNNIRKVQEASNIIEINSLSEEMIQEFCKAVNTQRNMNYSKLTQCLLYYLEHQYQQEITNKMLAEELETSVYYLIRKCKKETGITPQALLRNIRTTHAAQLLRETKLPIQEISEKVGILDFNYFTKVFKSAYGQTPSKYRNQHRL